MGGSIGAVVVAAGVAAGALALDDRDGTTRTDTAAAAPPTSPSTTTSSALPTTTTRAPRRATVLFGGDVLIHSDVWRRAALPGGGYDFSPMLAPLASRIGGADLAICHLEVTLAAAGDPLASYPRFRAPAELARDLAEAGYDGCSVSSNHALDFGEGGVRATLDALDAARLRHAGTARSPEEDVAAVVYRAGDIAVGHLSYSYGFNGLQPPDGKGWLVDAIDVRRIAADAQALRAGGAELVVVSLHWGSEYRHDPIAFQVEIAGALAATGLVDLVIGHHAHVVQPITRVGSMWVVYGLGNQLSNNSPGGGQRDEVVDGLTVTATIGDLPAGGVGVVGLTFTPTWNERDGFRVLPVADTLADPATPAALMADLRASWARTIGHVFALDGRQLGVRPDREPPSGG